MQGGDLTGFPVHDGFRRLEEARARGLRLVVVDPRRTEVAAHADLHLQLVPGTDVALFAAMLRTILDEGLHDAAFCRDWVDGLDDLRAAVEPVTPDVASAITGVDASRIVEAARVFGRARRGMAKTGTGPDMGPHANVAEHLVQAMNVVCGRFPRAGDRYAGSGVLSGRRNLHAQPFAPMRTWERGFRSRFGVGTLMGELPSPILPEEILEDGPDRVRALVVSGGNPAAAFPDQERIVDALRHLDLLVTVDPFPTETAQLAHYVIAPTMAFERADDTRGYEHFFSEPFAQSTPPILERPGDVIEDWEFFYELASRMGLLLNIGARVWEAGTPRPTSEEMLRSFAPRAQVPYDEVRAHPHGAEFDVEPTIVGPPAPDARGRFDLLPPDVARRAARRARRATRSRTRDDRDPAVPARRATAQGGDELARPPRAHRLAVQPVPRASRRPRRDGRRRRRPPRARVGTRPDHRGRRGRRHAAPGRALDHPLLRRAAGRRRRPASVRLEPRPPPQPHRAPPTREPHALDERRPRVGASPACWRHQVGIWTTC